MEIPTSNRVGVAQKRVHIKKGYYPARLMSVSKFADTEGNLKLCKYGAQIILEFQVFEAGKEGEPVNQMMVEVSAEQPEPVFISKFVYHMYYEKVNKKVTDKLQTAVTKNSAITRIFEALGWTFTPDKPLKTDDFLGCWVEANIDDYEAKMGDEVYKASGIQKIGKYEGPKIDENKFKGAETEPKKKVEDKSQPSKEKWTTEKITQKQKELLDMKNQGLLTEGGYKIAIENLKGMG